MRGGRGGRGGRWKTGRPQYSVTQDLIRDNLEDLGYDAFSNIIENFREPPSLYPTLDLPNPVSLNLDGLQCIQKQRELSRKIQSSFYNLSKESDNSESKILIETKTKRTFFQSLKQIDEDFLNHIPHELLVDTRIRNQEPSKKMKSKVDIDLQKLEQAEKSGHQETQVIKQGDEERSDVENDELNENGGDYDELDGDYGANHYASDDDNDGDDNYGGRDGGEATFE